MILYASAPDLDQLSALEAQLKQEKEPTINFRIKPNILTFKIDSLTEQKSQEINPNIYWKISIQRINQIPAPHISQSYSP